jgi:hypothetical protein
MEEVQAEEVSVALPCQFSKLQASFDTPKKLQSK